IAPGAIKTPINHNAWATPDAEKALLKLIPCGRVGVPEDIAKAAAWLASDESDYIYGATLFVDGGMTLYPGFATVGCERAHSNDRGGSREPAQSLRDFRLSERRTRELSNSEPRMRPSRHAPVAQLDRVLPSEGRGRRFESSPARQSFWFSRQPSDARSPFGIPSSPESLARVAIEGNSQALGIRPLGRASFQIISNNSGTMMPAAKVAAMRRALRLRRLAM